MELGRRSSGIAAHRAADDSAPNGPMPGAIKGPEQPADASPFEALQAPAATNGQWTPRSPRSEGCEVVFEELAPEGGVRQNGHAAGEHVDMQDRIHPL